MKQKETFMDRVRASMKSAETEGAFELYITRTPGFVWALFFKQLHVHPIAITLLSIVLGATSGYFLGNTDIYKNLIGVGLLIWANWYDCADGQLARMTGQKTLLGRVLDGFAGDVWFFSIYLFICLQLQATWGVWIWLLAMWSGFHCHARQCSLADYYRNIHLYFLCGSQGSELDNAAQQEATMRSLSWRSRDWFQKLYLFFYVRYTRSQERMTPAFQTLRKQLANRQEAIPDPAIKRFLAASRPLMKYCNILTFDTRVAVLFVSVLTGYPWIFFLFETTVLEVLRLYVRRVHEQACKLLSAELAYHE